MRMWRVAPNLMCRKHLLGEHCEMHMFLGAIRKGIKLRGYIDNGLVQVHSIVGRHDELAIEMVKRKYSHISPMSEEDEQILWREGVVDIAKSQQELARRCEECYKLLTI